MPQARIRAKPPPSAGTCGNSPNIRCACALPFPDMRMVGVSAEAVLLLVATGCAPIRTRTQSGEESSGQTASMGAPARDGKFEFTVTSLKRTHSR
jgi:hypothetical protein